MPSGGSEVPAADRPGLTRLLRDVGLAEELAQDALVAALERWPESGVPDNPGAWLMAASKNRALDLLRRRKLIERSREELSWASSLSDDDLETAPDEKLSVMICCGSCLSRATRCFPRSQPRSR